MEFCEFIENSPFNDSEKERIKAIFPLYPEFRALSSEALSLPLLELQERVDAFADERANKWEVRLLFLVNAFLHLYEKYKEKNLSSDLFFASVSDLASKSRKCEKIYGSVGIFTFEWYDVFLKMKAFRLGRLEFEVTEFAEDGYSKGGVTLKKGDTVLSCHIPATGALTEEKCFDSYRQASEFFAPLFPDGITRIVCHSWLFYPPTCHLFGKNTKRFISDFDIIGENKADSFLDAWRVFYTFDVDNLDALPSETSLQRGFIEYMKNGGSFGEGYGVLLFDGEKIINKG